VRCVRLEVLVGALDRASLSANSSRGDLFLKKYDYLVFIGRFQPFHNGHLRVINEALEKAEHVIILVGSANRARSPRNPFTFEEREGMIAVALGAWANRAAILPLRDSPYNDQAWVSDVQRLVEQVTGAFGDPDNPDDSIGLIGFSKDHTSYYLKMFPTWGSEAVTSQHGTLNSTDIRADYLRRASILPGSHLCPRSVRDFLEVFSWSPEFKLLVDEAEFYSEYKAFWGRPPFPVFINCVDAVVTQSGHILLVERARCPGKGLLALPGGHVERTESFADAVVRELKEETRISDARGEIPPAMLASFIDAQKTRLFDDPNRSERGRVVTQAYLFDLPGRERLFQVRGGDDAASASWYALGSLRSSELYEDHAAIIEEMTGVRLD
jgi:bifunctional NMN adenylyltransferase/nudix hydrolase